jgi:hypothetical protein
MTEPDEEVTSPSALPTTMPLSPPIRTSVRMSESVYDELQDKGYDSDGNGAPIDVNNDNFMYEEPINTVVGL